MCIELMASADGADIPGAVTSPGADVPVAVSLLGGLRVTAPGVEFAGGSIGRRAELILARLVLDPGTPVSREALADAVWGSALPASWRGSLRNAIVELRRGLADAGLEGRMEVVAARDGYMLALVAGSSVDLVLLRDEADEAARLLDEGDHSGALEVAAPSLTSTVRTVLPGGGEEWVEGLRAEVAGLWTRLRLVAGEAALARDDPGRAERLARDLAEDLPWREDVHRLLIRALRAAGRRAEALAVYDGFRRMLARELGAHPAPATQALFLEILTEERAEQPLEPDSGSADLPAAGALLRLAEGTPFVGRVELLRWLLGRARVATEGGAFVACVSGEPGIGKTRLAAELAIACRREGMGVLYGRAEDRSGPPYAALAGALEVGLAGVERPHLLRRRAGGAGDIAALAPGGRGAAALLDARPGPSAPRNPRCVEHVGG
jgi:DNA-binding SARP family transcriptional activator